MQLYYERIPQIQEENTHFRSLYINFSTRNLNPIKKAFKKYQRRLCHYTQSLACLASFYRAWDVFVSKNTSTEFQRFNRIENGVQTNSKKHPEHRRPPWTTADPFLVWTADRVFHAVVWTVCVHHALGLWRCTLAGRAVRMHPGLALHVHPGLGLL